MNIILEVLLKSDKDTLEKELLMNRYEVCTMYDASNLNLLHHCVVSNKEAHMRVILHYAQSFDRQLYLIWINHQSKEGFSPLLLAVSKGFLECSELLVAFGADIYKRTNLGLGLIHLCAQINNSLLLSIFYERGFDIHSKDNKGGSPLHWAAYMGSFNVLNLLLSLRANKNCQDSEGRTPLHLSIISANEKVARKLLVYGADPSIKDKRGRTPFDCAIESNAVGIIEMLRPLRFCEKVSCKNQIREPPKSIKHMVCLILFLTFSFCFVISFCTKSKIYIGNDPVSYIFIAILVMIILDLVVLITKDPGYIKVGKGISYSSLFQKNSADVCTECKIVRPPRSRHCYYCGRCVYRYDHHCQWVNNCVGLYNNNYFFTFLILIVLLCIIVDYIAITDFIYPEDKGLVREKTSQPPAAITILISTIALYPVSLLLSVQIKNYSSNLTSSERLSRNSKKRNPGFFLNNCWKMCLNKV